MHGLFTRLGGCVVLAAGALAAPGSVRAGPAGASADLEMPASMARRWPTKPWVRAEAFSFNPPPRRRRVNLYVWRDGVWSEELLGRAPLTRPQAERALELVHRTRGSVRGTKCPFPTRGVVFFDAEDQPVASVSVSFECEDVLVWPLYQKSEAARRKKYQVGAADGAPRILAILDRTLPEWRALFDGVELVATSSASAPAPEAGAERGLETERRTPNAERRRPNRSGS